MKARIYMADVEDVVTRGFEPERQSSALVLCIKGRHQPDLELCLMGIPKGRATHIAAALADAFTMVTVGEDTYPMVDYLMQEKVLREMERKDASDGI